MELKIEDIQIKRGPKNRITDAILKYGEICIVEDSAEFYMGLVNDTTQKIKISDVIFIDVFPEVGIEQKIYIKPNDNNIYFWYNNKFNPIINVSLINDSDESALNTTFSANKITTELAKKVNKTDLQQFEFIQNTISNIWNIKHNLNKYPTVVIFNNDNERIFAEVQYISINEINILSNIPFTGRAYLN